MTSSNTLNYLVTLLTASIYSNLSIISKVVCLLFGFSPLWFLSIHIRIAIFFLLFKIHVFPIFRPSLSFFIIIAPGYIGRTLKFILNFNLLRLSFFKLIVSDKFSKCDLLLCYFLHEWVFARKFKLIYTGCFLYQSWRYFFNNQAYF